MKTSDVSAFIIAHTRDMTCTKNEVNPNMLDLKLEKHNITSPSVRSKIGSDLLANQMC